ncbi:MAG TPA: hypothetical protein VIV14_00680, partial [Gammaproteobacteria bacterium]
MIASVFRNSAWSLIGNLGPLLVVLAAMPLTLRLYSAEQIGLIVILWAVLGYFGLLDLGLSRAVTYAIAAASKNAEPRRNAQIVTCGISLGIGIGLVLAAALWHFSAFIVAQLLG